MAKVDIHWSRPNPSRLNDTEAIVRKGTYPWVYVPSGTKVPDILTAQTAPENTFNGRSGTKFGRKTGAGGETLYGVKEMIIKCD